MMFIKKECIKCNKVRRFQVDTEREKTGICGECWDWKNNISPKSLNK